MNFFSGALAVSGIGVVCYHGINYYLDKRKVLDEKQHVVIIGGGYGGSRVALRCKERGKFTLIDPKEALHHNIAALRAAVKSGYSHKTFLPYKAMFGDNFLQSKVVDIDLKNKEVALENMKDKIKFTQLIIATGSRGPFPGKCNQASSSLSDLVKNYEDFTDEIKHAKKIVIVGGGAVGVELAGEIHEVYHAEKEVTVVHGGDTLVSSRLLPEVRTKLSAKLHEKNIDIVYNDKVINLNELPLLKTTQNLIVKTSNGKDIQADLVIPCNGLTVNTDAYRSSLGNYMNEKGQLKVNENLGVVGLEDVFAVGDCNDLEVEKMAREAKYQGDCVFENLVRIGKDIPLKPYESRKFLMAVTLGENDGVAQKGTKIYDHNYVKYYKGEDLFIPYYWMLYMFQQPPRDLRPEEKTDIVETKVTH